MTQIKRMKGKAEMGEIFGKRSAKATACCCTSSN